MIILEFVTQRRDVETLSKVCKYFQVLLEESAVRERREMICFYTKRTYETDILGVGIKLEYYPGYEFQHVVARENVKD